MQKPRLVISSYDHNGELFSETEFYLSFVDLEWLDHTQAKLADICEAFIAQQENKLSDEWEGMKDEL